MLVGSHSREHRIALRSQQAVPIPGMHPKRALVQSSACVEIFTIGANSCTFLLVTAKSDLLRGTIRELLSPNMKCAAGVRAEVHPSAIRRPGDSCALRSQRADLLAGRGAVKWQ